VAVKGNRKFEEARAEAVAEVGEVVAVAEGSKV
jgi:hypothetical protein